MSDTRPRGDARHCCVRIPDSETIDWYLANNVLAEANFFTELLTSKAVTAALGIDADDDADPTFTVESALSLDGVLAEQLVHGGSKPYVDTIEQQYGSCASAKRLARGFTDGIVEDRYEEMTVYRTRDPWSDWFGDPWWNFTLVVVDRRYRWAWVLVATDEGLMEAAKEEAHS
ncbi:hypothetical protein HWV23_14645 [Natronomonas halophila]|uniref:hypothetical protein n=1 Tax=Natronomonas halophila TaxID=2747817 RepID=UPI0015B49C38|nr:hypothetical protein [Natronomonas halophila]QLD86911.1 hypothetical protein HWV23_14645 [Natronomonas halophila]